MFRAVPNLNLSGDGWVVANVWDADDFWTVELFQDGKSKGLMKIVTSRDYWASYYYMEELNKAFGSNFDKSKKDLFVGKLDGDPSKANFDVVAKDKFGNTYHCRELTTDYRTIESYN